MDVLIVFPHRIPQGNVSHIDPKVADYTHEELVRFRAPGFGPIDVVPKDQFEAVEEREEQEVDTPASPALSF